MHIVFQSRTDLNIHILLGRCLEELDAQLIGQLAATLEADHTLILHVAFVAHQYDLSVVPRIRFDLCHPAREREREIIELITQRDQQHPLTNPAQS